jgi:hypothetical protein
VAGVRPAFYRTQLADLQDSLPDPGLCAIGILAAGGNVRSQMAICDVSTCAMCAT